MKHIKYDEADNSSLKVAAKMEKEQSQLLRAISQIQGITEESERLRKMAAIINPEFIHGVTKNSQSLAKAAEALTPASLIAGITNQNRIGTEILESRPIKKMLNPLSDLEHLISDKRNGAGMMEFFSRQYSNFESLNRFRQSIEKRGGITSPFALVDNLARAIDQNKLEQDSIIGGFGSLIESLREDREAWLVSQEIAKAIEPLKSWCEKVASLPLGPSAEMPGLILAEVLRISEIQDVLTKIQTSPDELQNDQVVDQNRRYVSFRKEINYKLILSIILLIWNTYDYIGNLKWQLATDSKLDAIQANNQKQLKELEGVVKLFEKALVQEQKRQETRFVVREREALVRANPESGSSIEFKLSPYEVVLPLSEKGKWIEFEYYDWIKKELQAGWALKKYFYRARLDFKTGVIIKNDLRYELDSKLKLNRKSLMQSKLQQPIK